VENINLLYRQLELSFASFKARAILRMPIYKKTKKIIA